MDRKRRTAGFTPAPFPYTLPAAEFWRPTANDPRRHA